MAVTGQKSKLQVLEKVDVRSAKTQHDSNKIAELWANLAMVKQMSGDEFWLDKQRDSGLNWFPYISSLVERADYKFIVLEDPEKIFGFAFLETEIAQKGKIKASLREFYIEPSHKDLPEKELARRIRKAIQETGIDQIQF